MLERLEHPADLAVLAFNELDDQMRLTSGALSDDDRAGAEPVDAMHHLRGVLIAECAPHGDHVRRTIAFAGSVR